MTGSLPKVRAAKAADKEAWIAMWRAFLHAKPNEPGNRETEALNWSRCMEPGHALRCLVSVDEADRPQGFTLYGAMPHTWTARDICYLYDIYVRPEQRGRGHARAMIGALAEIGRREGWFKIWWMTESDNVRAQRLYEQVAKRKDYLRYDLDILDP
jgi:ribosomal protein S18 acetylase RimI-like enzyme